MNREQHLLSTHHQAIRAGHEVATNVAVAFPQPARSADEDDEDYLLTHSIPDEAVDTIEELTLSFLNQLIQVYIDAGSERDAVNESLGPHINDEVKSWSLSAARKAMAAQQHQERVQATKDEDATTEEQS